MKRRRFQSITVIPKCGYVAICEEGFGWVFTFDDPEWRMLLELPPIEEPVNAEPLTREQCVKDFDSFFDPSLGQPWPEDQASDRAVARPRQIIYQHVVGQCIAGGASSELIACQPIAGKNGGLGSQDLPIRDWSNLAAIVDRAERLLNMSCWKRAATNPCPDVTDIIDISFALRSLVNDIRSEFSE